MIAALRLALVLAIAGVTTSSEAPSGAHQGLSGGENLSPFFAKLRTAGKKLGERPLLVLQIGDSHSAGDNISGAWRDILQARYGGGGRGVLPPGKPFDGYIARGVTVTQSPGWSSQSIFDPAFRNLQQHAIFGVSGYRLNSAHVGANLAVTADTPASAFNRVIVCAVQGPGAGGYVVQIGDVTQHVSLDAPGPHVDCTTVQTGDPQMSATVTVESGTVTLTSWATFDDNGGIALSNLGVVGAQISNFAETDDVAVAEELRAYQPDLIVLEFGTNDGFVGHFDPTSYEATLRSQIRRLQRLSGGVPILLLGAPDADTNRAELAANGSGSGGYSLHDVAGWFPPPALAEVREIQRRVAVSMGEAFWDWSSRMGGPATADQWANNDPPLMRKDRVHYTVAGGARIAQLLEDDLDAAQAADLLSDK